MAKLYFRYGAMCSSKSLNLLAVVHNYREQKKRVIVIKPRLDARFAEGAVVSRAGLSAPADLLVDADTLLDPALFTGLHCVLVDEAQFLSAYVVDQLRLLSHTCRVPVLCYGLRTDFLMRTFPGSRRLLELADTIEEVKTTCQFCNRKAVYNMRLAGDGRPTAEGAQVELGAEVRRAQRAAHVYVGGKMRARRRLQHSLPSTSRLCPPPSPHKQDKYMPTCFACYHERIPLVPVAPAAAGSAPGAASAAGGGGGT
jgi:thymidine kinase